MERLSFCKDFNRLIFVSAGFDMSGINKNYRRIYQVATEAFFKNPLEYLLEKVRSFEPTCIVFSEGAEMRCRLCQV